jgi:AraC family transcriptional regulator, regulatory protein of adaptative response / DNA-3-methyladenine glycosylase II
MVTPNTLKLKVSGCLDWQAMLAYLAARAFAGVETVDQHGYCRTFDAGWFRAQLTSDNYLQVSIYWHAGSVDTDTQTKLLSARLQNLFDLKMNHAAVMACLGPLAQTTPGVRAPGGFHGFEIAVRAILGQQITVKAATTLSGRFSQRFGQPVAKKFHAHMPDGLRLRFPTVETIAQTQPEHIAQLGIISRRANAIVLLAQALHRQDFSLEPVKSSKKALTVIDQLCDLPGIGPWTAHYIALRALKWADAVPAADVALYRALGVENAKQVQAKIEPYRPYRGYAVMQLWHQVGG